MELIEKYLGEATRCPKCGRPLTSKYHKENCEDGGEKKKGKYKLPSMMGYQTGKSMSGPSHGVSPSARR